jgi:hypothetical protein
MPQPKPTLAISQPEQEPQRTVPEVLPKEVRVPADLADP